jgi:hypothetical protein
MEPKSRRFVSDLSITVAGERTELGTEQDDNIIGANKTKVTHVFIAFGLLYDVEYMGY